MGMLKHDHPLMKVALQAQEKHLRFGCDVHQKWTCAHCGARQTMEEPNKFFLSGICEECKRVTEIEFCNYVAIFHHHEKQETSVQPNGKRKADA